MREHGFRRSGSTFRLEREGDIGQVNIQSSLSSTRDEAKVTANVAVTLALIKRFWDPFPELSDHYSWGHWQVRIGHLTPANHDTWWKIRSIEPADSQLASFVQALRDHAIPALKRHLSAEALRDIYLAGPYPFVPEIRRLRMLVVLVGQLGPKARFDDVASQLLEASQERAEWIEESTAVIERVKTSPA